jgi:hypothetical protein
MERSENRAKALRGQLFSSELMISLSLFIATLIIYLLVWNNLHNSYLEEQNDVRMQTLLIGISDAMVLSQGDPADWESGAGANANSYGLASAHNVLSPAKLYAMQEYFASNYSGMKEKAGAAGYDIFIDVESTDGTVIYSFGRLADTANQSVSAVSTERLAMVGDEIVKMRVQIWRTKGPSIL